MGLIWLAIQPVQAQTDIAPEPASPVTQKRAAYGEHYMVSSASPFASKAGAGVLEAGGNALDAAIAVQMALNVAEPQSSGIGGGGFLLFYDAKSGEITAYDGRETAPATMPDDAFLQEDGTPKPYFDAVEGGLSVGTPGVLKMLALAHKEHGRLPWKQLFTPAIHLAKEGVPFSPRLHVVVSESPHLAKFPEAAALYYTDDGAVKPIGTVIKNPTLANTIQVIAKEGITPFYEGKIAEAMVKTVRGSEINPGYLSMEDLTQYTPKKRTPLCIHYRTYRLCGMPPPSSGASTVFQALKLLEPFDLDTVVPHSAEAIHLIAEASKLAFADRNAYLADSDFVRVPLNAMFAPDYLKQRSAMIDPNKAMEKPKPGNFGSVTAYEGQEPPSTSHISIIDQQGNAVSFTSSIEYAFGSGLMTQGFMLNNQLTDFSFLTSEEGKPIANRIEAGKRPRSSMSPVMVFDEDGKLLLVIGSPGGVRIIAYVLQTLVAVLDWQHNIQAAISAPRYANVNNTTELEQGTALVNEKAALEALGHLVSVRDLNSGLHGVSVINNRLVGAADPRREGEAIGR